jgi:hypothetical protein
MAWKKIVAGVSGFLFGFWFCMPRQALLQPRYEVLVSDASGKGIAGARVWQIQQDHITSRGQATSSAVADSYGRVAFPAVRKRTSPLLRTFACARQKIASRHEACGYSYNFTVETAGNTEIARSESDLPLHGRGRLLRITLGPASPPRGTH